MKRLSPPLLSMLGMFCSLLVGAAFSAEPLEVTVDFGRILGPPKRVHGLNCGPSVAGGMIDLSAEYRELGVPWVRLHDCHWPTGDVVDIHAVFPNPLADPSQPENYVFGPTDEYLAAIRAVGSGIIYRLGESIEHTPTKRYVRPPRSPEHWADVCLGIVRHYNEGWANGFRYGIRYWEIWNEPENRPAMWTGSDEDFFRLYAVTVRKLKTAYPELRVGGPGLGYTGQEQSGAFEPSPFLVRFLEFCRQENLPLDFFSWHIYTNDPSAVARRAVAIRNYLNTEGFSSTESHLNEWNYLPDADWSPMFKTADADVRRRWFERMQGAEGAAFAAAVLALLQDAPVDISVFYRGETGGFSIFDCYGARTKQYWAIRLFSRWSDYPERVAVLSQGKTVIVAARRATPPAVAIFLAQPDPDPQAVRIKLSEADADLRWKWQALVVDEERDGASVSIAQNNELGTDLSFSIPPFGVCLLQATREKSP